MYVNSFILAHFGPILGYSPLQEKFLLDVSLPTFDDLTHSIFPGMTLVSYTVFIIILINAQSSHAIAWSGDSNSVCPSVRHTRAL